MITIRFIPLENLIELDERYVNVIEISEKNLFKKIVYLINKYSNNIEDGNDIVLMDKDNRLEISKNVIVINDFFNLDLNNNKIIKSLYSHIEKQYNYEYGEENLLVNLKPIMKNIQEILQSYDFELEYKRELKISELLKCLGMKYNTYFYDNPFDNILCLFDIVCTFKLYKVIVLVNAKSFFMDEEIVEIYKSALSRDIRLLLLDFGLESKLITYENKLYVDDDFDEFIIKNKYCLKY